VSKPVFPQTPADDPNFNRTGGLSFRELASIHIAAQLAGAFVYSPGREADKAKNLAQVASFSVVLAESLEKILELGAKAETPILVVPSIQEEETHG
jgi:hypothetical protein